MRAPSGEMAGSLPVTILWAPLPSRLAIHTPLSRLKHRRRVDSAAGASTENRIAAANAKKRRRSMKARLTKRQHRHKHIPGANRLTIQRTKNADSRANGMRPVSPGLYARALLPAGPYGGASRPLGKAFRACEKLRRLHANVASTLAGRVRDTSRPQYSRQSLAISKRGARQRTRVRGKNPRIASPAQSREARRWNR